MLLRIIDKPADKPADQAAGENSSGTDDQLLIVLQGQDDSILGRFVTEDYLSPTTANFRQTLAWYFSEYLHTGQLIGQGHSDNVVEKIIKLGQNLGEQLLGEDHQLVKMIAQIEQQGYPQLQVRLESKRLAFFQELWETLILPDGKYLFATVVNGFERRFSDVADGTDGRSWPALDFQLAVTPPVSPHSEPLQQLLTPTADRQTPEPPQINRPLRVLVLHSRGYAAQLPYTESQLIHSQLQAMTNGAMIEYDLLSQPDAEQLHGQLVRTPSDQPRYHVVQYDGPVVISAGQAHVVLADNALLAVSQLAAWLVAAGAAMLVVDARAYLSLDGQPVGDPQGYDPASGLAQVALACHQQGLGNVIGMAQITNPWISGRCLQQLYQQISRGFSVAQGVVETRKALQSDIQTALMTTENIPFHGWSLLVHYSQQAVVFFASPSPDAAEPPAPASVFGQRLLGFKPLLLAPEYYPFSDGQALAVRQVFSQTGGQCIAVSGPLGSGKTHLAHVLCQSMVAAFDFSFYFDFGQSPYSSADIWQMISPVILPPDTIKGADETALAAQQQARLGQLHCCFVFDQLSAVGPDHVQRLAGLAQLTTLLLSQGHKVLLLVEPDRAQTVPDIMALASQQLSLAPLTLVEQKILAAKIWLGAGAETSPPAIAYQPLWDKFLSQLHGHPWLTEQLVTQFIASQSPSIEQWLATQQPLLNAIAAQPSGGVDGVVDGVVDCVVEKYYQMQWQSLPLLWQRLLLLCSEVPGLLLEMVMIAVDQPQPFGPAQQLIQWLSDGDSASQKPFAEGLKQWQGAGFISRFPHGRMVDERCLNFLNQQRPGCFSALNKITPAVSLAFSQLICEGIRILAPSVVKQQNPSIANNLLINRRFWVRHFERLWFGQDYRGFMAVKQAFEQLLQQVKLSEESQLWVLDLLTRSDSAEHQQTSAGQLAWLALTTSVLGLPAAKNAPFVVQGAEQWRRWLLEVDVNSQDFNTVGEALTVAQQQQLALFQQVTGFLQQYYQLQGQWSEAIVVAEKAAELYRQHQAWFRLIPTLQGLAKYHGQLGDKQAALAVEDQIINDIPYQDAPQGFKTEQLVAILFARLDREQPQAAQFIVDQLTEQLADQGASPAPNPRIADLLAGAQCDIDFQQQNYRKALPFYCQSWVRLLEQQQALTQQGSADVSLQQQNTGQIEILKQRLLLLEDKLGPAVFTEIFNQTVPATTVTPRQHLAP